MPVATTSSARSGELVTTAGIVTSKPSGSSIRTGSIRGQSTFRSCGGISRFSFPPGSVPCMEKAGQSLGVIGSRPQWHGGVPTNRCGQPLAAPTFCSRDENRSIPIDARPRPRRLSSFSLDAKAPVTVKRYEKYRPVPHRFVNHGFMPINEAWISTRVDRTRPGNP